MIQQNNPSSKKKSTENSNNIMTVFSESFRQICKAGNTTNNSSNLVIFLISI